MSFLTFYLMFAVLTGISAHYFLKRISDRNLETLVMSEGMPEVFANKRALIVLLAVLWPLAAPVLLATASP